MKSLKNKLLSWKRKKLGNCGIIQSGGTPDTNKKDYWQGTIPWITPSEVTGLSKKFVQKTERYLTEKGLKDSSAVLLPSNSLIICTRATVGNSCINVVPMCTNQGFKNLIPNSENDVLFLYYLIENNKKDLIRKACGSTFLEISKKDIVNLSFLMPPTRNEQEKIVEVLECWDKGIELVKKLIEQKELQKKYLMQQLLSGTRRFKGFTQKWETARISEIKDIIIEKGHSLTKQEVIPGNIPVIAGGQTVPFFHNKWTHNFPCITISASGAYAGYVWKHTQKIYASDCNVLYSNNYNLDFLYCVLKYNQNYLYYIQTGGAQGHIYASEIGHISIPFINAREQQAIAEVLSSADKEIDLLKQKLAKLEAQKKGLMQVLLTGKIRLK